MEKRVVFLFNKTYAYFSNIILFLLLTFNSLQAQRIYLGRSESGFILGGAGYYGDLSHGSQYKHVQPALGFWYRRAYPGGFFSTRYQIGYQSAAGTDADNKSLAFRNLTFYTPILNASALLECNFHEWGINATETRRKGTSYAFIGIGGFWFNPTRLENKDVNLVNFKTNGGNKYSLIQPSIPMGLGYKRKLGKESRNGIWVVGAEMCWFKTYTDKLDDVGGVYQDYGTILTTYGQQAANYAQPQVLNGLPVYKPNTLRGDEHLSDWFYYFGVTLSFKFHGQVCP